MKHLLITFGLLLILTSCNKDEVDLGDRDNTSSTEEMDHCLICPEQFVEDFTNYQSEINITLMSHSECSYERMWQKFQFRMEPYIEDDGKFFYQYKKRSEYDYTHGSHIAEWSVIPGLYRYDYTNRKAYLYSDISDAEPRLLMDFNLNEGDSIWIADGEFGSIYFIIEDKVVELIDEVPFPKMYGTMVVPGLNSSHSEESFVSPYYPNPIIIDHEYDYYLNHDWTVSNFQDAYWYQHAHFFSYELKEIETDEVLSAFYSCADN